MKFFVSYSRSVKSDVGKIIALLKEAGHEVWWDGDIPLMADWWATIVNHIEWCDVFIFVVSEQSVLSAYCLAELMYATDRNRPILPFVVDDHTRYTIPPQVTPMRAQWFIYNGNPDEMLSNINTAITEIQWEKHRDIFAPRPPEPNQGGVSLARQYQEARRLADNEQYEAAKTLFRNIKSLDYGEWGEECDAWIARLNSYPAIVDLVSDASTMERARREWQEHHKKHGREFDPHNIAQLTHRRSDSIRRVPVVARTFGFVALLTLFIIAFAVYSRLNDNSGTTLTQVAALTNETPESTEEIAPLSAAEMQATAQIETNTASTFVTHTQTPTSVPTNTSVPTATPTTRSSDTPIPTATATNRPTATQPPPRGEKVTITWFVGLSTGSNAEQVEVQQQLVDDFNARQDAIELVLTVNDLSTAHDALAALIAAGTPPDIVGPFGVADANYFGDIWLDLQPLVDATGYDLNVFDESQVRMYRTEDGKLFGIPFVSFPTLLYYNRNLFDEAGLNYPPSAFGEPYIMSDGTRVEWNYDTVAEIAGILTVDANGNDATMPAFDRDNVVQYGLNFQWGQINSIWANMQPEDSYNEANNNITIPESWRGATSWLYDGLWGSGFIPNDNASISLNNGNAFASGSVAMAITPLWYTCCISNSNFEWDLAVVPRSFDGAYHVVTDADTFRISISSPYPAEAFTVLSYLLGEAVPALVPVYAGFPARPEYQQQYIDSKSEQYPWVSNWDVASASLAYSNPANMSQYTYYPNTATTTDRISSFSALLFGYPDIDIQAELNVLEADLNIIINE